MKRLFAAMALAAGLAVAVPADLPAQGRGNGGGNGNGKKQEQAERGGSAHGRSEARGNSGQARGNGAQARGNSGEVRGNSGRSADRARPQTVRRQENRGDRATAQGQGQTRRALRNNGGSSSSRSTTIRWTDRRERYDDFSRVSTRGKNGEGPAFCRSGAGHPNFGRQWCLDKGFGLGRTPGIWTRAPWSDIRFGTARRTTGSLARDVLIGVLGSVVYNRLAYGSPTPLTGQWVSYGSGPAVLQLYSGSTPMAELTDYNGDGRVDLALVNLGRY